MQFLALFPMSKWFTWKFLKGVEALPDDMQRNISQMRELDLHYQERLKEIERLINNYLREKDPSARRKCLIQIQRRLIKSQEYGDDKLQLVGNMIDMVDTRTRQIEVDVENLDTCRNEDLPPILKQEAQPVILEEHPTKPAEKTKRNRRQRNHDKHERDSEGRGGSSGAGGSESVKPVKKKAKTSRKGKSKNQGSPTPEFPIDPNEPTYCLCNQVSFGEMIGCDNEECPIEWFHFQCVGLTTKPKGKWYCPKCMPERKRERSCLR